MAKSMTGFGRAHATVDGYDISVELKSVNHKFFEASVRLPRGYSFLEEKVKAAVQSRVARGKLEIYVTIYNVGEPDISVDIDREYADAYVNALKELVKTYKLKNDITVMGVAANNDVFRVTRKDVDEEKIAESVIGVVNTALDGFIEMRRVEGKRLADDIMSKLDFILEKVAFIEERSPETVKLYRERLEARIKELLGDEKLDEQRIITETAIFADKIAVDEETVRLRSHIDQVKGLLVQDISIGRKLDFIIQEMNREVNTTGSKAQDTEITACVVDMKSEIEKIREQIQNIE